MQIKQVFKKISTHHLLLFSYPFLWVGGTVGGDLFAGSNSVTFVQVPKKLFEAPSSPAQPTFAVDAQSRMQDKDTNVHTDAASYPNGFPLPWKEKFGALGQGRKGKFLLTRDPWRWGCSH